MHSSYEKTWQLLYTRSGQLVNYNISLKLWKHVIDTKTVCWHLPLKTTRHLSWRIALRKYFGLILGSWNQDKFGLLPLVSTGLQYLVRADHAIPRSQVDIWGCLRGLSLRVRLDRCHREAWEIQARRVSSYHVWWQTTQSIPYCR